MRLATKRELRARLRRLGQVVAVLAVFLGTLSGTYLYIARDRIWPAPDQLVVYGRNSCAITTRLRERLATDGIPFSYASIDAPLIGTEMWIKLGALRGAVRSARLPVVEINGAIHQRPAYPVVRREYERAAGGQYEPNSEGNGPGS